MMILSDIEHHLSREHQEREKARAAHNCYVRAAHQKLADRHGRRATELRLMSKAVTDKSAPGNGEETPSSK